MKVIQVPDPVQIEGQQTPTSFLDFLRLGISSYPVFANGIDNIEKGLKLKTLVKEADAKKAKRIHIEDADYEMLKACICDPRFDARGNPAPPFIPAAAIEMVEFFRAVKNASQEISAEAAKA